MFTHLYRQSISCILSTVLLGNTLYAGGIVVDSSAAASNRPTMESTPNAIPLINIVTPNAAGLSHNKFTEFNIEQRGVIFNNATSATLTQMGGWVAGNANLGMTPARVILNEVTGTNRSLLSGYGEVAGHRADLIIANPNGITINGGGFINTSRATLTTGTPILSGDSLNGFHVRRGDILIEGSGFNADNIDRVELYTKTLQLNGQLHAKELDLITGENTITRDGTISSDTVAGSGYSIDSSALGGIYGSTIRLVGTDKGVGINLPRITYASDSLSLSADGHIVIGAAVASKSLTSQSESLTVNEMLYGGDTIDLSASDTIHNTPNALILSHGEITIHDTGTLLNDAARIEASGDIVIQADRVENLSNAIPIKTSVTSSVSELIPLSPVTADSKNSVTEIQTIDKNGYTPAYLLSGGDMVIDAAIHNRYSLIASDQDMYLFGSLDNEASVEARTRIDITHNYFYMTMDDGAWHYGFTTYENTDTLTDHVYSTIQAGGNLYGNLISVNNADVTDGTSFSSSGIAPTSYTQNTTTGAITYTLPSGGNGEFVLSTDPSHNYLIESNPLFTDYGTFISSDYILSRLNLDTAANTKRLGDARYETQLVRDAVFRLTGERYLAGFGSDTSQYQALMDNALALSGDLHLELGVTLSASQVARLNKDIVWMEDRVVSGQHVLVPVVYLASLNNMTLSGGGKIIAKGDIQLDIAQGLNNAGEIRAGGTLLAQADSITNTDGTIKSASDMLLHTTNDITNTSGKISGNNVALVSDNGSIVSKTALKSIDLSNHIGTTGNLSLVGERASIQSKGDMTLSASKDITLTGAETSAGGNVALSGKNVTLTALEQNSHYSSVWESGSSEIGSITQHASTLNAGGGKVNGEAREAALGYVSINAAKDVTLTSSMVEGKNVAINALGNINLTAASNQSLIDVKSNSKKSDFISSNSTSEHLNRSTATSVASSINGDSITLNSGNDINVQGSNIIANNATQLTAAHDINVLSSVNTASQTYDKQVKKSGFFSGDSAGVMSVGYSKSKNTTNDNLQSTQAVASNIVSLTGDTTLSANNHLQVSGSNLEAGNNLNLTAKAIDIVAAKNTQSEQYSQQSSSKGLSIGITKNPKLAAESAYEGSKGNTPETGSFMNTLSREFEGSNAAVGAALTPVVMTAHNTSSSTQENYNSSTAAASTLTAGGNLNIIATDGSINALGAQISAEGDALLLAKKNILLLAANSTTQQDAKTTAKGLVFDNRASANTPTDMLGVYSKKGNGEGGSSTLTPTQLSIGGTTTLKTAEGDIALMGANIASSGDVTIDSARNLLIQSSGESGSSANTSNNKAIGKVYISDTERFSGYHTEKHKDNGANTLQISSNIASLGGSVNLTAGDAYTQTNSNVMAANDVTIKAKTIDIDTADNTFNSQSEDKALKIGAFARVGSPLITLVNSIEAAEASDGRLQTMQSMAAAANVYQVASALTSTVKDIGGAAVSGGGKLAFVETGVGVTTNRSAQSSDSQHAQGSAITGGNNVTLTTTEGDIHASGATITAGQTLSLDSAKDILLDAGVNTDHSDGKNSGYGVEVGVGASVGAQTGVYAYVGVQASHGSSNSDGTTYDNTHLSADTINLKANDNLTLSGADARANTITADAGENLTIQSLQDHENSTADQSGMNLKVQVSIGTAWGVDGGANAAQGKGNYQSVNQQSGLFAGDGGYNINVGKNTNLIGGAIASSDKAIEDKEVNGEARETALGHKNTLTTGTLTTTDLENHSDYSAGAIALSTEGAAISGAGVGYESGSQTSLTRSAISQGTITITDEAKQLELTGKTAEETIANINTDTANAHTALEPLPDINALLKKQQAMAGAMLTYSQVVPKVIGDYSTNKQKELESQAKNETDSTKKAELQAEADKWSEGGIYRVGLHTIAGGLVGDIGGAIGSATVASSAPLLESFQNSTTQALIDAGMSADSAASVASGLASITAAGMGALAGSSTGEAGMLNGAATAYNTDTNNRQLHNQEIRWIKNNAKEYAKLKYGTDNPTSSQVAEAEASLAQQAMRQTDKAWSLELGSSTDKSAQAFLQVAGNGMFTVKDAYEFANGNTNGMQSVGSLSASEYQQLKDFTLVNAFRSTTFNSLGARDLLSAYGADANKQIDAAKNSISWSAVNGWLRNAPRSFVQSIQETPQMVNSAENWVTNVAPTTTQNRMNDLYGQGNAGSQVQANLATMDMISTVAMATGAGTVAKSVGKTAVDSMGKAWEVSKVSSTGEVTLSQSGLISGQQITRQGVPAALSDSALADLKTLSSLDNASAGVLREQVANNYFTNNGFTALDGKCGSNCFDGVYIKGDQVIINEVKPLNANNTIKMSSNTSSPNAIGTQMTDQWIVSRATELKGSGDPVKAATGETILNARDNGTLVRIVSGVNENGMTMVKVVGR